MAYLRNTTINLLNLHYGLHTIALSGGGVFFGVFLLKVGVPAPVVLCALALILGGRFCLRPLVLVLGKRVGVKPLLIFGSVACALQYPLVARVHGVDLALLELCIAGAVSDTFYWTSYHAYFAALGDEEHRGHQIGAREALAALVGVLAPLAGGWALVSFGPAAAFGAFGIVQVLSAAPLLGAPSVPVAPEAPLRLPWTGLVLFAADGWINAGFVYVWQIALFLALGSSFTAFGGAMAIAALAAAAAGLLLGRHIDRGHGRKIASLAIAVLTAATLARAAAQSAAVAVLANAVGAIVTCIYVPAMMTAVYNLAKRSACPLRFHFMTEGAWDLGCGSGCLAVAGLIAIGVPIGAALLLSLAGAVVSLVTLRRYYGDRLLHAA